MTDQVMVWWPYQEPAMDESWESMESESSRTSKRFGFKGELKEQLDASVVRSFDGSIIG
jgi:hypothetical protein